MCLLFCVQHFEKGGTRITTVSCDAVNAHVHTQRTVAVEIEMLPKDSGISKKAAKNFYKPGKNKRGREKAIAPNLAPFAQDLTLKKFVAADGKGVFCLKKLQLAMRAVVCQC